MRGRRAGGGSCWLPMVKQGSLGEIRGWCLSGGGGGNGKACNGKATTSELSLCGVEGQCRLRALHQACPPSPLPPPHSPAAPTHPFSARHAPHPDSSLRSRNPCCSLRRCAIAAHPLPTPPNPFTQPQRPAVRLPRRVSGQQPAAAAQAAGAPDVCVRPAAHSTRRRRLLRRHLVLDKRRQGDPHPERAAGAARSLWQSAVGRRAGSPRAAARRIDGALRRGGGEIAISRSRREGGEGQAWWVTYLQASDTV
eukprot:scaffold10856_cov100-Isochrysis_galbana.AAC.9